MVSLASAEGRKFEQTTVIVIRDKQQAQVFNYLGLLFALRQGHGVPTASIGKHGRKQEQDSGTGISPAGELGRCYPLSNRPFKSLKPLKPLKPP